MRGDVIASSAPMSGGLLVPYPAPEVAIPMMFAWGGEGDEAVGQDFHLLAVDLLANLAEGGHFVVTCNHGDGHQWPEGITPGALEFLLDHPRGVDPLPWADGLPAGVPDYYELPLGG